MCLLTLPSGPWLLKVERPPGTNVESHTAPEKDNNSRRVLCCVLSSSSGGLYFWNLVGPQVHFIRKFGDSGATNATVKVLAVVVLFNQGCFLVVRQLNCNPIAVVLAP